MRAGGHAAAAAYGRINPNPRGAPRGGRSTMNVKMKLYRWRKKILVAAAALPMCQAANSCALDQIPGLVGQQIASATFSIVVNSVRQTLLTSFPSADVIQILLGGNRQPFISQ
jgi:hypothetical protein